MSEIEELEKSWKIYQRKKRQPLLFFILVLSIILLYFFTNKDILKREFTYFNKTISSNTKNIILNSEFKTIITKSTLPVKEKNSTLNNEENRFIDIPILNDTEISAPLLREKKSKFTIFKTSSATAYKDVEKRFFHTHEIDDAFFLAKSYYSNKSYEKAKFWALEVNKLDPNHEESLLIFIQSIIYLGNKNEGISLLEKLIKNTNSDKAKVLLHKIENNKF
jgi:tetratricopeptide (TPR) repeat protein